VHNACRVGGTERRGDLNRHVQNFYQLRLAAGERRAQGHAVNKFRTEKSRSVHLSDFVNRQDVRVIKGRGGARFLYETLHAFLVPRDLRAQKLERDRAIEFRIERAIDFAHPACAEQGLNLVAPDARSGFHRHRFISLLDKLSLCVQTINLPGASLIMQLSRPPSIPFFSPECLCLF
jgi:hypothetical protein